jgi:hypothetical protein
MPPERAVVLDIGRDRRQAESRGQYDNPVLLISSEDAAYDQDLRAWALRAIIMAARSPAGPGGMRAGMV